MNAVIQEIAKRYQFDYRQWYSYLYFDTYLEKNQHVLQILDKMKSYLVAEKSII
ncbi:hypothetical protein ACE1TH_09875 [Shouchella sp. JSM 1781072]|uniref:hypothetical protein n=1 Tax=Bacillaceae TaxID=186817 RepID=UPI0020D07EFF|nr:hypothetical protein [Alkalihalobacillus sp. LMS6]UTR07330.1 hypothetical protein MM326_04680 [Alkalihalobacillus sp. LMS6]